MDHRDKLLKLVHERGPILPSAINKELDTNVLFASAMLSEMVDAKKLRLTNLKIGGSPLYYCPGQEDRLANFSHKLNEKDQRTFELIKKEMILRDKDQEPLTRVSLREIKDFAIPLQVTVNDTKELFWKYYLITDEEAHGLIKRYLENKNYLKAAEDVHKTYEAPKELPRDTPWEEPRERMVQQETREETTELQADEPAYSFSYSISEPEVKINPEEPKIERKEIPDDDVFYQKVKEFFRKNDIRIEETNLIRKGSEIDFVIRIPSPVGKLRYFCKAKSKKKMNDGDVSSAYVAGTMKQLPVLFLIEGELTGRALDMAQKELKSFVVKEL